MTSVTYFMGIDVGTTTCRAVIFDQNGTEVAAAYRETRVAYPRPLWAEVDPNDWWTDTCAVVREALSRSNLAPTQIAAVGVSGLMHAPVLLDDAGEPVAPAQLWMDQRCASQADALRRELSDSEPGDRVPIGTGQSAPKLRWLAEHAPHAMNRAQHFLLPKDFVRYRLTSVHATDSSDAGGTGMFDRARRRWDAEVVRRCGISSNILPPLTSSAAIAGSVTGEAAANTGLVPGTPVAVGAADTLCTRLGVGTLASDEVCVYLGTAAWVSVIAGSDSDGHPILRGFGSTSTTGAALRWIRDLLDPSAEFKYDGYARLERAAAEVAVGAEELFFLPHLMGERGPRPDPLARGALVGLTLRHGRPHLIRAVLEGTAFQLRRVIQERLGARIEDADCALTRGVACGGGAKSRLWIQTIADVTGLTLRVPIIVESAALGAAILAATAIGTGSISDLSRQMVRYAAEYEPKRDVVAQYDSLYRRFCLLDDLLAPFYHVDGI